NLGSLAAQRGDLDRAIRLWQTAFDRDPATVEAGINLAIALGQQSKQAEARGVLQRVQRFDPSSTLARRLLLTFEKAPGSGVPQHKRGSPSSR
ncbi:MAG: tetratricopeptide repeat protein, partial [Alphaproteobacteria bacterium]|nr:tetratricopeptide repeat protein [Alphaproteobacteria bacterium]